jgi:hypothetical protein
MSDRIKQITAIVTGIIALSLVASAAEAQQAPSGASTNTAPGLPTNLDQLDNTGELPANIFVDPNNSSQDFFEQGREELYLLPKDSGEHILKIDKTIKADGVKYDDLEPKLPNHQ